VYLYLLIKESYSSQKKQFIIFVDFPANHLTGWIQKHHYVIP